MRLSMDTFALHRDGVQAAVPPPGYCCCRHCLRDHCPPSFVCDITPHLLALHPDATTAEYNNNNQLAADPQCDSEDRKNTRVMCNQCRRRSVPCVWSKIQNYTLTSCNGKADPWISPDSFLDQVVCFL